MSRFWIGATLLLGIGLTACGKDDRAGNAMAEDVTCILHPGEQRTIPVASPASTHQSPSAPFPAPGGFG